MSRRLKRRELEQTVVVHDATQGGVLGELVNITTEGLMLAAERELEVHAMLQLSLQLPEPLQGVDHLLINAECLWSRRAEKLDRYWAGFHIVEAAEQALLQIEALIDLYAID